MPTVDSKDLVDELIRNNGHFSTDPIVVKIVEYTTTFGNKAYGLIYEQGNKNAYNASFYIRNPKTIFEYDSTKYKSKDKE